MRDLLAKDSDATFLREMIGFAAQRLMELEIETLTGAAHGKRSPDRRVRRNGYRERDWHTRADRVELRIRDPWLDGQCPTAVRQIHSR